MLPDVQRARPTKPAVFTPRRSKRLAARNAPVAQRFQLLLAASLGLDQGSTSGHQVVLSNFVKLFDNQLSHEHIAALVALFKISVPGSLPSGFQALAETILPPEALAAA